MRFGRDYWKESLKNDSNPIHQNRAPQPQPHAHQSFGVFMFSNKNEAESWILEFAVGCGFHASRNGKFWAIRTEEGWILSDEEIDGMESLREE